MVCGLSWLNTDVGRLRSRQHEEVRAEGPFAPAPDQAPPKDQAVTTTVSPQPVPAGCSVVCNPKVSRDSSNQPSHTLAFSPYLSHCSASMIQMTDSYRQTHGTGSPSCIWPLTCRHISLELPPPKSKSKLGSCLDNILSRKPHCHTQLRLSSPLGPGTWNMARTLGS